MQVIDAELTLSGSDQQVSAVAAFSGITRCSKLEFHPDPANANVVRVKGRGGNVVYQLAVPASATAVLDRYVVEQSHDFNNVQLADFAVNGTNTQKVRITAYVA